MWNKVDRTSPMVFHRKRWTFLSRLIPSSNFHFQISKFNFQRESVLLSHPIESHLFLRRLAKLSKSKNDKLPKCAEKFLEEKFLFQWIIKTAETMGKSWFYKNI